MAGEIEKLQLKMEVLSSGNEPSIFLQNEHLLLQQGKPPSVETTQMNEVNNRQETNKPTLSRNIVDGPGCTTNDDGKAKHILQAVESGFSSLDAQQLYQIFGSGKAANLPVAIYSVAGEFRKGKSFLLNLFYQHLCNITQEEWKKGNLAFDWKRGTKACTKGLWMVSKPFVLKAPNYGDVAVYLMDTEGIFDLRSKVSQSTKIFALSTLMSSVQIFNIMREISENDLQYLQLFAEYGKLIQPRENDNDQSSTGKAFQSLHFLVRDWPHRFDYPYGSTGGDDYLRTEVGLNDNITSEESSSVCQTIVTAFEKRHCFLMPEPNKAVRHGESINLEDIGEDFEKHFKDLARNLFDPEKIVPKIVCGRVLTGSDFYRYFSKHKFTNEEDIVEIQTLFELTAQAAMRSTIEEGLETYNKKMTEVLQQGYVRKIELDEAHKSSEQSIMTWFEKKKKMGSPDFQSTYKDKLKKKIEEDFKKHARNNENEKEKQKLQLSIHLNETEKWCKENIEKKYEEPPLWPEEWEKFKQDFPSKVRENFNERARIEAQCLKESYIMELDELVKTSLKEFKKRNEKRVQFEEDFEKQIAIYEEAMNQTLENAVNQQKLKEEHEKLVRSRLHAYKMIRGEPVLEYTRCEQKLKETMENKLSDFQRKLQDKAKNDAREFEKEQLEAFENEMVQLYKNGYTRERKLKNAHRKFIQNMKNDAVCRFPDHDVISKRYLENLSKQINIKLEKHKEINGEEFLPLIRRIATIGAGVTCAVGGTVIGIVGLPLEIPIVAGGGVIAAGVGVATTIYGFVKDWRK